MKIVIYRDKKTNKIVSFHKATDCCTDENLRNFNENEKYPTKAEFVEFEEGSVMHYFYQMNTTTIEQEADNLRDLMDELTDIANRIDDRLYDFDRWFREEKGNE